MKSHRGSLQHRLEDGGEAEKGGEVGKGEAGKGEEGKGDRKREDGGRERLGRGRGKGEN